jgi:hypothetical protein
MLGRIIYNIELHIALRKATETTKVKEAIDGKERSVND